MMEPMGRGEEPQVRTTVASKARRDCARQFFSVLSTNTSKFSMCVSLTEYG
jgi:hypothetical protein